MELIDKYFPGLTEEQRRRILARNGERAEMFFTRWIPFEERYFREMDVERRCDLVIHND